MKAVKRKCFEMPIVHWKVKAQESVQSSRGGRGQREVSREEGSEVQVGSAVSVNVVHKMK